MKYSIAAVIVFISFAIYARDATSSSFNGVVSDSSGAPIPAANVIIASNDTGDSVKTVTDATGAYYANDLIGERYYSISVEAKKYLKTVKKNVLLPSFSFAPRMNRVVNFVMQPSDGKTDVVEIDVEKEEPIPAGSIMTVSPIADINSVPIYMFDIITFAGSQTVRQIQGVVTSFSNTPMNGLIVHLYDYPENFKNDKLPGIKRQKIASVTTCRDGKFKFINTPPGKYELRVRRGINESSIMIRVRRFWALGHSINVRLSQ